MTAGLLKPLAVFSCQSQSQHYIKCIRNIGDAWRTSAENPLESEDFVVVETKFDLVFKITKPLEEQQYLSKQSIVQMSTDKDLYPPSSEQIEVEQILPKERPRHYRIFTDYGTDFIWRDPDDVTPEEGDTLVDPEEVLALYPPSILKLYDCWVETYTENFRRRRDETGDYKGQLFRLLLRR